jgi:hypothetical protein
VLGLDETSAAPTSSARVSHAMADTIDTSSAAVQSRGCMEIGIHTSGGTCIHSVRILGPYARCAAKKISLERAAQLSFLKSYFIRVFVNANRSADLVQAVTTKLKRSINTGQSDHESHNFHDLWVEKKLSLSTYHADNTWLGNHQVYRTLRALLAQECGGEDGQGHCKQQERSHAARCLVLPNRADTVRASLAPSFSSGMRCMDWSPSM